MEELEHAGVNIPPPLIFIAYLALGIIMERVLHLFFIPTVYQIPGIIFIAISFGLIYLALSSFRSAKTAVRPDRPSTKLVDYGIYKYTRNPMYLSMIFAYVGLAFYIGSFWTIIMTIPLYFTIQNYVIQKEEKYLKRKFGKNYEDYLKITRRWI